MSIHPNQHLVSPPLPIIPLSHPSAKPFQRELQENKNAILFLFSCPTESLWFVVGCTDPVARRCVACTSYKQIVWFGFHLSVCVYLFICLTHEVKHQVDVSVVVCLKNIHQAYDVVVACELLQKHYFAECTLGVCGVVKGLKDFLQRHYFIRSSVIALPHHSVCLKMRQMHAEERKQIYSFKPTPEKQRKPRTTQHPEKNKDY